MIIAAGDHLYQMHKTGLIWKYTGTPLTGWQMLDNNPDTTAIAASGNHLYQRHKNGRITGYTGIPLTGWKLIDDKPTTQTISPAT